MATMLSDPQKLARFRARLAQISAGLVDREALIRAILATVPLETAEQLSREAGIKIDIRRPPVAPVTDEVKIHLDADDRTLITIFRAMKASEMSLEDAFRQVSKGKQGRAALQRAGESHTAETDPSPSQIQATIFDNWATKHQLYSQYYTISPNRPISDWARDGGKINQAFLAAVAEVERAFDKTRRIRDSRNYSFSPYGAVSSAIGPEAALTLEVLSTQAFGQISRQFDLFSLAWTLEPLFPSRILVPLQKTVGSMKAKNWVEVMPDEDAIGLHHRLIISDSCTSAIFNWLQHHEPVSAIEFRSLIEGAGADPC
jgi:hypothetical protein